MEDSSWIEKVNWKRGNVFQPETYIDQLKGANAVVHSIGILLENASYKKIVGSNDGIINAVGEIFKTPNPMLKTPDITGNVIIDKTYSRYNTESAMVLAESLIEVNKMKPAFVYISADRGFPGIPSGYIESKRQAEYGLYKLQPEIRPIFLRPGFMYDPSEENQGSKSIRGAMKNAVALLNSVNKNLLFNALDGLVRPGISTKVVARWCLDRIETEDFRGPVMLEEMTNIKK